MNHLEGKLIAQEFKLTKPKSSELTWRDWVDNLNDDDLEKLQGA